jgi:hypothetical protein
MQLVVVLGVALVSLFSNTTSLPGHQNRHIESLMQTAPVSICRERRGGLVGEDDLFMNQPLTPFVDDRVHDLPGGTLAGTCTYQHTSIPAKVWTTTASKLQPPVFVTSAPGRPWAAWLSRCRASRAQECP